MDSASRRAWLALTCAVTVIAGVAGSASAQDNSEVAALKRQVQTLEQRLAKLEKRLNEPMTVKAPFVVQDNAGARLLVVADGAQRGIGMFGPTGKLSFSAVASSRNGGLLKVYDGADELTFVAVSADYEMLGLRVRKQDKVVAELSRQLDGTVLKINTDDERPALVAGLRGKDGTLDLYREGSGLAAQLGPGPRKNTTLRIYGPGKGDVPTAAIGVDTDGFGAVRVASSSNGQTLAEMGRDTDGGGSVVTYQRNGKPAAALATVEGGRSAVQIYSIAGSALASLGQGANGGMLQLNNTAGLPMVEAGNNGNVGLVRTGPMMRATTSIPGLPGSYILGSPK